jgi:hypothetical protein
VGTGLAGKLFGKLARSPNALTVLDKGDRFL